MANTGLEIRRQSWATTEKQKPGTRSGQELLNTEKASELRGQRQVHGQCRDREGPSEAPRKSWSREKIVPLGESGLPRSPEKEYANLHLFFWKEG